MLRLPLIQTLWRPLSDIVFGAIERMHDVDEWDAQHISQRERDRRQPGSRRRLWSQAKQYPAPRHHLCRSQLAVPSVTPTGLVGLLLVVSARDVASPRGRIAAKISWPQVVAHIGNCDGDADGIEPCGG
jgi:hypothetical protein